LVDSGAGADATAGAYDATASAYDAAAGTHDAAAAAHDAGVSHSHSFFCASLSFAFLSF